MILNERECLRCGSKWRPRIEGRPVACPRCHSNAWDKERVRIRTESCE